MFKSVNYEICRSDCHCFCCLLRLMLMRCLHNKLCRYKRQHVQRILRDIGTTLISSKNIEDIFIHYNLTFSQTKAGRNLPVNELLAAWRSKEKKLEIATINKSDTMEINYPGEKNRTGLVLEAFHFMRLLHKMFFYTINFWYKFNASVFVLDWCRLIAGMAFRRLGSILSPILFSIFIGGIMASLTLSFHLYKKKN